MKYLTVALAKGRLSEQSVEIFEKIGFDCSEIHEKSRKLVFTDEKNKVKFILVKATDVPTYVHYGAADIGIVGKDTLLESGKNLYEVLDLKLGKCAMCVCGYPDKPIPSDFIRVASKYPNIARDYFAVKKNRSIELIKLNGSVELAPIIGLSDVIVDIVESGKTLRENGLDVIEKVCEISARLVVNRVSMKMEKDRIMSIAEKIKEIINDNCN